MHMKACSVTVNIETSKRSFDIFSDSGEIVSQFVGIHPQYVLTDDLDIFKELIESNLEKVDGIGEIGCRASREILGRGGHEVDHQPRRLIAHRLEQIGLLHHRGGRQRQLDADAVGTGDGRAEARDDPLPRHRLRRDGRNAPGLDVDDDPIGIADRGDREFGDGGQVED